jgi:hypothetical protein
MISCRRAFAAHSCNSGFEELADADHAQPPRSQRSRSRGEPPARRRTGRAHRLCDGRIRDSRFRRRLFRRAAGLSQGSRHRLGPAIRGFASFYRANQPNEAGARRLGQGRRRNRAGGFTGAGQHRRILYARAGGCRRSHGGTARQVPGRAGFAMPHVRICAWPRKQRNASRPCPRPP